ncbi:hypothetical protein D3C87_1398200 [compost metagenome]
MRFVNDDEAHAIEKQRSEVAQQSIGLFEGADDDGRLIDLDPGIGRPPIGAPIKPGDNHGLRRDVAQIFGEPSFDLGG